VTFTVTLSEPSGQNVTAAYTTQDGTALAGSDYQPVSGLLTFSPGQTVRTITVQVIGDAAVEGNEAFQLVLSNPVNATLTSTQATATIVDDETFGLGGGSAGGWSPGGGGDTGAPAGRGRGRRGPLSAADAAFARWASFEAFVPDSVLMAILTKRER
jgi:Calx-beta domain